MQKEHVASEKEKIDGNYRRFIRENNKCEFGLSCSTHSIHNLRRPAVCSDQKEETIPMCDYSLHQIASRPAKVGDELVTTEFVNTFTRGFAAVGEPNTAVCLLPGTELAFKEEAEREHLLDRLLPWLRIGKLGERVARFRQIAVDQPNVHHDALEFANGKIAFVTTLRPGQRATVVQLPVDPRDEAQIEERQVSRPRVNRAQVAILQE